MIRVVLTGTANSGKTSLLEALGKEGYKIIPEAETQIVRELIEKWGIEKTRSWILPNYFKFKEMVGERQAYLESQVVAKDNEIVIYDRCAIDWVAFCKLRGIEIPSTIQKLVEQHKYQYIFLCDMLSSFDVRGEEGRVMTKEEALKLKDLIIDIYKLKGYTLIPVFEIYSNKEENIRARVAYIKKILESGSHSSH